MIRIVDCPECGDHIRKMKFVVVRDGDDMNIHNAVDDDHTPDTSKLDVDVIDGYRFHPCGHAFTEDSINCFMSTYDRYGKSEVAQMAWDNIERLEQAENIGEGNDG